jgi:ribosome-associated toxin RatA of RatAB toxin-antitoxin module
MVRAVSYDSKLFKELSTTWRFTPNIPKTTTLEATMDQEVQETRLLTRPAAVDDGEENEAQKLESVPAESTIAAASEGPSPIEEAPVLTITVSEEKQQSAHYFTAAAVFGEAALPRPKTSQTLAPSLTPSLPSPSASSTVPSPSIPDRGQLASTNESLTASSDPVTATTPTLSPHSPTPTLPLRSPSQRQVILQRTASPSNLATMKPSDYPSCWIDFEIEFEFESPVHASMSSLFFDQVSKEMLAAFVKRAEVLYGKR